MPKIHNIYITVDIAKTKDQRWSIIDIRNKIDITIAAVSMTSEKNGIMSGIFPIKIRYFWTTKNMRGANR